MVTGNTGDPATLASQVTKVRQRFGLAHVTVAGDRGVLGDLATITANRI
jgi:hypothetical protein